jgi:hypothetical protein
VAGKAESNNTIVAGLTRACAEDLRRLQHEYNVMLETATKDTSNGAPSPAEVALRLEMERKLLASTSESAQLKTHIEELEEHRRTLEGGTMKLEATALEFKGEMEKKNIALFTAEQKQQGLQRILEETQAQAAAEASSRASSDKARDGDEAAGVRVDKAELERLHQSAAQVKKLETALSTLEAEHVNKASNAGSQSQAELDYLESEMLVLGQELDAARGESELLRTTNAKAQAQIRALQEAKEAEESAVAASLTSIAPSSAVLGEAETAKLEAQAAFITKLESELHTSRRLAESLTALNDKSCIASASGAAVDVDIFSGLFVANAVEIADALARGDLVAAAGNFTTALSRVEVRWLTVPVLVPGLAALNISLPLPLPEPAVEFASRLAAKAWATPVRLAGLLILALLDVVVFQLMLPDSRLCVRPFPSASRTEHYHHAAPRSTHERPSRFS